MNSVDNLLVSVAQKGHIRRDKVALLGDGVRICEDKFLHLAEGVLLGALSLRELDTKRLFWLQSSCFRTSCCCRSPCLAVQIALLLGVGLLSLHQGQLASY